MTLRLASFTTWTPDTVELHDGTVYPCRQISAGGLDLLQAITSGQGADIPRAALVDAVAAVLPTAPRAEVLRCSVEELIAVLVCASVPASALQDALGAAEKKSPAKRKASR